MSGEQSKSISQWGSRSWAPDRGFMRGSQSSYKLGSSSENSRIFQCVGENSISVTNLGPGQGKGIEDKVFVIEFKMVGLGQSGSGCGCASLSSRGVRNESWVITVTNGTEVPGWNQELKRTPVRYWPHCKVQECPPWKIINDSGREGRMNWGQRCN